MKRTFLTYFPFLLFASLIIALDQWTKWLVRENIPFGGTWLPEGLEWLSPYARIVHWQNSGAAFGIFQNGNAVFSVLATIVIIVIIYYYPQVDPADWSLRVAMGMQMAGAAGNLIDRLMHQEVTDFISVGRFAVFNVADASITVGVGVLLLGVWLKERAERRMQNGESGMQNAEGRTQNAESGMQNAEGSDSPSGTSQSTDQAPK